MLDAIYVNPREAEKCLIPRPLKRFNAFADTSLLSGGVIYSHSRVPHVYIHIKEIFFV
jgi:hypothetical protein